MATARLGKRMSAGAIAGNQGCAFIQSFGGNSTLIRNLLLASEPNFEPAPQEAFGPNFVAKTRITSQSGRNRQIPCASWKSFRP